jgi:hypothetical protein
MLLPLDCASAASPKLWSITLYTIYHESEHRQTGLDRHNDIAPQPLSSICWSPTQLPDAVSQIRGLQLLQVTMSVPPLTDCISSSSVCKVYVLSINSASSYLHTAF